MDSVAKVEVFDYGDGIPLPNSILIFLLFGDGNSIAK